MTVVKMIEADKRNVCRCYFCGTNKSVKYIVDPEEMPGYVPLAYACNRCVAEDIGGIE